MTFSVANCSSAFPGWLHRRGAWSKACWNPAAQSWGGSSSLRAPSTPQPSHCYVTSPFLDSQQSFLLIIEALIPTEVMGSEWFREHPPEHEAPPQVASRTAEDLAFEEHLRQPDFFFFCQHNSIRGLWATLGFASHESLQLWLLLCEGCNFLLQLLNSSSCSRGLVAPHSQEESCPKSQ